MRISRGRRLLMRPDGIEIVEVPGTHPVLIEVGDLCYETLHRPFGVTRQTAWNETDPSSAHLVAFDGDRLAGYARLIAEGGGGHVRQVVVPGDYRGRGIASDLVACAVSRAAELGLPFAYLNARARAIGLYERLGFRAVGERFRMGRTYLPHVRMERPLRRV
jgi:ribosomal protein S18 acetylase RimI-like enzyme